MDRGWQTAKLTEIPGSFAIPVPGRELTPDQEWEAVRARDPAAAKRWEEFDKRWPDSEPQLTRCAATSD